MCFLVKNYRFDEMWDDFDEERNQVNDNPYLQDDVVNGKAIKIVSPDIPPRKGALLRTVKIIIRVITNEDGSVTSARAVCDGNVVFTEASLKAAYKSKFAPTRKNGVPIKGVGLIIYNIEI